MNAYYSVGLDIHKKLIAYCVKAADGRLVTQGMVGADRESLSQWAESLPGPWVGAMEATIFTGWVYDFLALCGRLESGPSRDAQSHHRRQEEK